MILRDRYELTAMVTETHDARLYRSRDLATDQRVIVKQYRKGLKRQFNSYGDEVRVLERLDHPRLPHLIENFEDGNGRYIVMTYMGDVDLYTCTLKNIRFSQNKLRLFFTQGIDVLAYLESLGIVHSDVKLGNFVLSEEGFSLVDFGLSSPQKRLSAAKGTWEYMPLEVRNADCAVFESDIYSFGITFEKLIGLMEMFPEHNKKILRDLGYSPEFIRLLERMKDNVWSKRPKASEIKANLEEGFRIHLEKPTLWDRVQLALI